MDEILKDLDFCFAYIDGILVFSRSPQEHDQVWCGCRRVSPSCAAECPEKRRGLLLLLLMLGRWRVMCRILRRIPLLRCAEYYVLSFASFVGVTNYMEVL